MRKKKPESIFDQSADSVFASSENELAELLGFLNSSLADHFLAALNPTITTSAGVVKNIPFKIGAGDRARQVIDRLADCSERDWDAYERSWDFQSLPLLTASSDPTPTLESSYTAWTRANRDTIAEMKRLEEENNRLFIDAYGLADELTPDVPIEQITLTVNPAYRYGGKLTEEEQWTRFRQDTMEELVSYAIGCMMGRYSLDAPGLIYAHSGNEGFDHSQYTTFPSDDDGIVPLTDTEWFEDDACNRVIEFISKAWDESHLEANLTFLAENLSPKKRLCSLGGAPTKEGRRFGATSETAPVRNERWKGSRTMTSTSPDRTRGILRAAAGATRASSVPPRPRIASGAKSDRPPGPPWTSAGDRHGLFARPLKK